MPEPLVLNLPINGTASHVDVKPGEEIILRGFYTSKHDGAIIDAATTTFPAGDPRSDVVDRAGLFEISERFGWHLTSRDPVKHEVHAVAVGGGEACAAFGAAPPCLPSRIAQQAHSRLLTAAEWQASLLPNAAGISVELPAPPLLPLPPPAAVPYLGVAGGVLAAGVLGLLALRYRKRQIESPAGRLLTLGRRVREKLSRADGVVAAPLAPAIEAALKALRERRIDASSTEGKRIADVLQRVETRLDESAERARAHEEQQAADELVREFESALEAADEATLASKG